MAGRAVKSKDFNMGLRVKAVKNSKSGYVAQLVSQVRLHKGRGTGDEKILCAADGASHVKLLALTLSGPMGRNIFWFG